MGNANESRAKVLRFWRAVELFSPQDVPRVDLRKRVYQVGQEGLLPWEAGHPLRRIALPESKTWRHTVYGGVFSLRRVRDLLEEAFGSDDESFDTRLPGDNALFAVNVTDDGRPLLGSVEFSSCAWATGRLLLPGPEDVGWLTGFEDAAAQCDQAFTGLVSALDDDARAAELRDLGHEPGRPLDVSDLSELVAEVAERFGVAAALQPTGFRIVSIQLSPHQEFSLDGGEFLSSFFAADLARLADAVTKGDYGAALDGYLRGPGHDRERIDLRERPGVVDDHVAPQHTPAGRWPATTTQPLALSQQFAANTVLRELAGTTGIFAVNGPPGTGKTTMLRELVAAIVVERARRLAELPHPRDAFTGELHWKTGNYTRTVSAWHSRLTGFEIVVASSNNGAVENISREIPGRGAIDEEEWLAEASYYAELATAVVNSNNDGTKPEVNAWGLVAGCLGKKANRRKFARAFWFGDSDDGAKGFQEILKDYEVSPGDWQPAVQSFRMALREVERLREERADVQLKVAEIPAIQADIGRSRARLAAARTAAKQIKNFAVTDPDAAADAAWAAADTLHVTAKLLGNRVIRQAADAYDRAARMPCGRLPRPSPAGNDLRRAARLMARAALPSGDPVLTQLTLLTRLASLIETIADLREAHHHAAQAAAARQAAEQLHAARAAYPTPAPAQRARTRTRAERTRLDFPLPPTAWPRETYGIARPGRRSSSSPRPPRPRGPKR